MPDIEYKEMEWKKITEKLQLQTIEPKYEVKMYKLFANKSCSPKL